MPYAQLWRITARGRVAVAVHHVRMRALALVVLAVLGTTFGVTTVTIGTTVSPQLPLQKGNGLDVNELAHRRSLHDVPVAHARGVAVGGDLHQAALLDEAAQRTEEETHQILVTPTHERVAIEETLDHSSVREVVIHGAEPCLHAKEARVHSQASAIHVVHHFSLEVVQLLDGGIDFGVPLSQDLKGLEGGRHSATRMTQGLPVLREQQRESEVGIAANQRIGTGVDEL
mmetsp:Transcript_111040/g.313150  ORF Transcript_111040/g.313150 Transcript_111040/m.313150 type:complete len:229 (+) Transcript_111040:307-993(+)